MQEKQTTAAAAGPREMSGPAGQRGFWCRTPVIIGFTFISCFLWGSAFPSIKIGYELFAVGSADTASQILFAGIRFTIAGLMVILIGSVQEKKVITPHRATWGSVLFLSLLQTIGQYFFFYIGLAHASGVSSAILVGANTFFCILVAAFVFHTEKMTVAKTVGCLNGFLGILLIQLPGKTFDFHVSLAGEGAVLASTLMSAFSSSYVKRAAKKESAMTLSGWQFLMGGLVLAAGGFAAGGKLANAGWKGGVLLLYMSFISAAAYTLWSILLKYNPVSRIAVFGFINPIIGVILSAVLLGESGQAFSLTGMAALVLVCIGIIVVYRVKEPGVGRKK